MCKKKNLFLSCFLLFLFSCGKPKSNFTLKSSHLLNVLSKTYMIYSYLFLRVYILLNFKANFESLVINIAYFLKIVVQRNLIEFLKPLVTVFRSFVHLKRFHSFSRLNLLTTLNIKNCVE